MGTQQNKAIVQRWIDAINTKDITLCDRIADETYAPHFVLHDPSFPSSPDSEPGPAGARKFVRQLISNAPDVRITIDDMITEGDKLAFRLTVRNTPEPDTVVMSIIRFVDGKFAEEWQLGVPGKW